MTPFTIIATSQAWLIGTLSWSTLGYLLLAFGIVAVLFSKHRYLIGYLLAGMGYWLVIEGVHYAIASSTSVSTPISYVIAFIISGLMLGAGLRYRRKKHVTTAPAAYLSGVHATPRFSTSISRHLKPSTSEDKYIEHTPIYNNYQPRFKN